MPEIIGTAGHTVAIEVASANQAEANLAVAPATNVPLSGQQRFEPVVSLAPLSFTPLPALTVDRKTTEAPAGNGGSGARTNIASIARANGPSTGCPATSPSAKRRSTAINESGTAQQLDLNL